MNPAPKISIRGEKFFFEGKPTYSEVPGHPESSEGLLMNARFIQGIFDDQSNPERFARFGQGSWDPEGNTDRLIAALPQWRAMGLLAFTVGFQGGGPVFTTENSSIDNNPFGSDGKSLDPAYASRMDRLIRGAEHAGLAVIVSYLYQGQQRRLADGQACRNAVITASRFLKEGNYPNVLIEVANEYPLVDQHPIVGTSEGISYLIDLARRESGGLPTGSSPGGGDAHREVCQASDYILIHGNGCTRQAYHQLIRRVREYSPGKPVVCNEDSPCVGQMGVALDTGSSWGYYNNLTKQEPPSPWEIQEGEDRFFALRAALGVGLKPPLPGEDGQYCLAGLEKDRAYEGRRWVRLASLFPETIDKVEFFLNGKLLDLSYDEPFFVRRLNSWMQESVETRPGDKWEAHVHRPGKKVIVKEGVTP